MSDSPLFQRRSHDQAQDLRLLAAERRAAVHQERGDGRVSESTRVIAVTSGKGGVGKTSLTVNLAVTLAKLGKRVIVLDCDLGTANVDVMLGMHPRYSLQHVLSRQRSLEEVMTVGPHGVRVISGGSGFSELANLSDSRRDELLTTFATLEGQADVLLLDTGAGISANVLRFVVAAGEALVVTTPEPTAVTDAYALIKVVSQQSGAASGQPDPRTDVRLRLVINQAASGAEAQETASNIVNVAQRFLGQRVQFFGSIPADRSVSQAVRAQTPVVDAFPRSPAAQAIDRLARMLLDAPPAPDGALDYAADAAVPAPLTVAEAIGLPDQFDAAGPAAPVAAGGLRGFGGFVQRFLGVGRHHPGKSNGRMAS
ncbi:MAG TPA: MinD/ParA family protein [Chloroflexota bacterium]|nr:MinD/ParA family protein [Chloroflexota bacterium]